MTHTKLIEKLRGFAQTRFPPRSAERRLMHAAADALEDVEPAAEPEITVEAVEKAMGDRRLFPWQKKALRGQYDE